MLKIENVDVAGIKAALRGMRNPMNSWDKSDSYALFEDDYILGESDLKLGTKLVKAGPTHRKFLRMIIVWVDITAPLYWWKEFDTYKVGTVANSCSTMHKIQDKKFDISDFSCEHLVSGAGSSFELLHDTIRELNTNRQLYLQTKDKKYWWQMIQLLPSSYNQKRTIMMSYEVLANIYATRAGHKLDEWKEFLNWVETLPYFEFIEEVR